MKDDRSLMDVVSDLIEELTESDIETILEAAAEDRENRDSDYEQFREALAEILLGGH